MKYLALLAIWLAIPLAAFSQCSTAPTGGTQCVSPIRSTPPAGSSPTSLIEITPATAQWPCISGLAAKDKAYVLCGNANTLFVDFGDGNGYVNLQGKQGVQGIQGPPGVNGTNGLNGTNGMASSVSVGTTTTLPAGSHASVTNSGSSTNAVFNFSIPAGQTGQSGSGMTWPISMTCATAVAAKGGTGVPKFSVTQLVLTNCVSK